MTLPFILSGIGGGTAEQWGTTVDEGEGGALMISTTPSSDPNIVHNSPQTQAGGGDMILFNVTSVDDVVELATDFRFLTFMLSLGCALFWVLYITFYSSRIIGLVVTKVVNRFIKDGYIKIGSISMSVLSGKIMFRDVAYVTEDCSLRIQDGWVIFRWWRAYVPKDITEDMSHSDTRLSILLNGFEYHLYNRSELYSRLEKLFGLDSVIFPEHCKTGSNASGHANNNMNTEAGSGLQKENEDTGKPRSKKPPSAVGYSWRDLIPVIKLELCCGRVVFGSMLVPYTLALVVEEAHVIYTTKTAASRLDKFMHIVKCRAENFKVVLSQSPKYTGLKDEPPRLMGEGFGIVTSNKVEFYYYMDEPGTVPSQPEMLQLANGELVEANPPMWGIDIKCGKGTDFSYGPWADRQREQLYKLFYPQDYQPMKPTPTPVPGEQRQIQSFDVRLSTLNDATIDILFSKDQETNAVHMNIGPGSYLEVTIPWVVHSDGYTTKITGQLLHLEASTSLQYRNFVESETLQFTVRSHYPIHWNDHQDWWLELTGCKASVSLIYGHKWFFQAMVNDWSSRTPPDILHFVPYTWKINFCLKEFEIITAVNEYNWIDCSSQYHENNLLAACGEQFELSFDLPFHEFLPETVLFKFWIQIEGGDLNFFVPEVSTAFVAVQSLGKTAKIRNTDGSVTFLHNYSTNRRGTQKAETTETGKPTSGGGRRTGGKVKKWRNVCQQSTNWVECWSVPICAISISFTYHPMPPLGPTPQADVTTPEKEESLLSPIRIPGQDKEQSKKHLKSGASLVYSDFEPLSLPADRVHVELEVGPSVLLLYGSLLKLIINLKENIFGDYQEFIDMERIRCGASYLFPGHPDKSHMESSLGVGIGLGGGGNIQSPSPADKIDFREYRPLDVSVSAILHDIRGHLLKNCNEDDPPCPTICVERFGFEMNKKFRETQLQVLLSPIMLLVSDTVERFDCGEKHLGEGYLMLSGLQVRGHAMFSNEGRSLDQETLEYAWLIEVQLGRLSGRLSTPHLENIMSGIQSFVLCVLDEENNLRSPQSFLLCHHGNNQFECEEYIASRLQPTESTSSTFTCSQCGEGSCHCGTTPQAPPTSSSFGSFPQVPSAAAQKGPNGLCPTSEEIKYKMVRLSVDAVDIYVVEGGTALSLWVSPIRLAICNLHGHVMREGFTLLISNLQLRHFVMVNPAFTKRFQFSDLNIIQSSSETMTAASWTTHGQAQSSPNQASPTSTSGQSSWSYLWLEVGVVALGPFCVEMALRGSGQLAQTQLNFLIKHDKKTKRLWFLWKMDSSTGSNMSGMSGHKRCACAGGCAFFGSNAGGSRFFWPSKKDWMDGVNVACFRVNKQGEDAGFGQSILKQGVLVFDTPPYTTQGTTVIEMPSEYGRSGGGTHLVHGQNKAGGKQQGGPKTPFTFKPSLLADLSHTSSSASPHNERYYSSSTTSTLTSSTTHHPSHHQVTRRKLSTHSVERSRISDSKLGQVDYSSHQEEEAEGGSVRLCRLSSSEERQSVDESLSNYLRKSERGQRQWDGSYDSLDSLSDVSFISALSVQEECMVNLQMHLNKPITESSLLMPCYMSHLTQLKCDNWHVNAPTCNPSDSLGLAPFVQMQDGKVIYAGSKYTPYFEPLVDGFTTLAMVDRDKNHVGGGLGQDDTTPTSASCLNTPSQTHFWETPIAGAAYGGSGVKQGEMGNAPPPAMENDEFYRTILNCGREGSEEDASAPTSSESTTLVIRTKNDVNIMVSPMLLEALQKFVEAITPTLCSLHPLTMVNNLHGDCISRVEKANLLKKEKSVFLMRMQNSKRNTAIRQEATAELSPVHSNLFEQVLQTAIQGSISIPKMNLTLLQASVVEEVISFSALDNIRDLMCVSMLAVAIERTDIYFLYREQEKKTVQVLHRPAILPKAVKKRKSKVSASESILSEPVFIENSEKQSELISTSIDISRLHAQLRRLKNDSSILKEAVITAIPNQHSKVLFRFAKIPCNLAQSSTEGLLHRQDSTTEDPNSELSSEQAPPPHHHQSQQQQPRTISSDEKLGFIMCECGLEGISLKGIKNSESRREKSEEALREDETVSVTLCNELANSSGINVEKVPDSASASINKDAGDGGSDKETTTLIGEQEEGQSEVEGPQPQALPTRGKSGGDEGAASASCVIRFKVMWYNFAAPPQTPITRKIDYTRVDWNLVSTASTAINAWLNPIDQLTLGIVGMLRGYSRRTTGLLASLMAEALEIQSIHQPTRSKYSKLTPMAKTLQEDPSCQLCIVLRRFIAETEMEKIEGNVAEARLPQLSTLRQGVIVLSRQWKNVLYTPLLLEHNLKSKKSKNFTVTFTLPHSEEESPGSDGESVEETTDERATLLDMEGGTVSSQSLRFDKSSGRNFSSSSISELSVNGEKKKQLPPANNRASDVYSLPDQNALNSMALADSANTTKLQKDLAKHSSGGSSSILRWSHAGDGESEKLVAGSGRSTPGTAAMAGNKRLNKSDIIRQVNEWNQSNEAAAKVSSASKEEEDDDTTDHPGPLKGKRHFSSEQSHEESLLLGAHTKFPQHPSLMLLDAHVIFKPLLTSMGLMPHQIMGYSFDHLGSHMSIKAAIDLLRIDIVESELKGFVRRAPTGPQTKPEVNFVLNIPPEVPAFLCEKIGLEGDFQKSADMSRDVLNRRSMIYLSRNYWKKQAKSAIIFSVNIDYISQQVNMPLLRLLHQITTMYQNVRETQMELREQRPLMAATKEHLQSESAVPVQSSAANTLLAVSTSGGVRHKNSSSSDGEVMLDGKQPGTLNRQPSGKLVGYQQSTLQAPSTATNTMSGTISSALATRTQSFAQRFKKGSSVLHHKLNFDGTIRNSSASQTPTSLRAPVEMIGGSSGAPIASSGVQPASSIVVSPPAPNCWRTIYYLLDLYATRPETKTVINNKPPAPISSASFNKGTNVPPMVSPAAGKDVLDEAEKGLTSQEQMVQPSAGYATNSLEKQREHPFESPRISVFGIARIQRTRLLATLSGLKLEAEIMNLQASCSYKKKVRPAAVEFSLTGHVGQSMIVLLEGVAPNQQTVVRVSVAKSGALYSSVSRRMKDKNSALLTVGPVIIDIPQHPVVLHGMMTRSTKQLSNTLQEFRVNRTASRISRGTTFDEVDFATHLSHQVDSAHAMHHHHHHTQGQPHQPGTQPRKSSDSAFFQPLQMQFTIVVQSLGITAALLPSLQAQYKMEMVKSCGITGSKAKFQIRLPVHTLSFTTKLSMASEGSTLPSAACISLPQVDVSAEYIQEDHNAPKLKEEGSSGVPHAAAAMTTDDGVVLRTGSYLSASADIGAFEHCLTTDLLNHLVFVQKVFMKEVNEVVLKMSGGDKPVPLWEDDGTSRNAVRSLLFSLVVRLQSIQITATTPTNTAVRLETGLLEFQMSNRVKTDEEEELGEQQEQEAQQQSSFTRDKKRGHHHHHHHRTSQQPPPPTAQQHAQYPDVNKVFIKAQVDVNLSLGQLIRNMVFEEAESEYQQYAFFKTRIGLRNVADMSSGHSTSATLLGPEGQDKEVVLITLTRPLIYVQPIAVDKAILVWLNYKSAYEYWNEQRSNLNSEVMHCTGVTSGQPHQSEVIREHHPRPQPQQSQTQQQQTPEAPPVLQSSTLFLQLTVDDMGISIPLNPSPHGLRADAESRGAVVVTLESTSISACSSGSLVSKGRFTGLCFRFTDDMVSMDDWKPNLLDPTVMNFCVVSEGTYEVCSRTTSRKSSEERVEGRNAKWFLNVQWQMEGVDMHVDVNIGKQLSALGHTLTTLAAFEEEEDEEEVVAEEEDDRDEDEEEEGRDDFVNSEDFPDSMAGGEDGARRHQPRASRSISQESVVLRKQKTMQTGDNHNLPAFLTDPSVGPRQKRSMLEKEMQERISLIDELNKAGSPQALIEEERKKLQELENVAFRDFRRDWIKKLRRQSTKAAGIRDKFSWSGREGKSLGHRSKSLAVSTPDSDKQPEWRQHSVDSGSAATPDDEDEFVGVWLEHGSGENIGDRMSDYPDETDEEVPSSAKGGYHGSQLGGGHMTPGSSVSHSKPQEPNVDLELDVKVFINSGKCVLHTKAKSEDEDGSQRRKRSERSGSGYDSLLHINSPIMSRKGRHNLSTTRLKSPFGVPGGSLTDVTTFHIPGLDVKIHYDSHTLYEDRDCSILPGAAIPGGINGGGPAPPPGGPTSTGKPLFTHERSDSGSSTGLIFSSSRRSGTKRASMFAWITLHSVPEETIISPHILDFLEQTLEPIPMPVMQPSGSSNTNASQKQVEGNSESRNDEEDAVTSTYYASFPVDVIVYFHMQPSTFRFSCQPVSRVECMLRLPALDIVFSSKRAEEEYEYAGGEPIPKGKHHLHHHHHHLHHHSSFTTPNLPTSFRTKLRGSEAGLSGDKIGQRDSTSSTITPWPSSSIIGGLSVTGCLSDFSLYIFHPYGAAKKADQWSPLSDNERKDSVSMNVEFVKFHLSRSRKVHLMSSGNNTFLFTEQASGAPSPGNPPPTSSTSHQAAIRFSTIVDIGSASFKYDMRRLTEILAFPKAWYRRSLVRRVFLGDMSTTSVLGDDSKENSTMASSILKSSTPLSSSSRRNSLSYGAISSPRDRSRGDGVDMGTARRRGIKFESSNQSGPLPAWETLVLFTVNFTKLNVQMNMGNVMGNVSWLIRDAKSEGKLSIGSTGHKNLYIGVGLNSSYIEAKGGIVAGTFELTTLNTYVRAQEDPGVEPHHTVGLKMHGLELRLDFMGTSVLMGRVSGLQVKLKDEWLVQQTRERTRYDYTDDVLATYRPAMIFIHGDMGWDQLQLMISKSTTVDLLKMHCKLEEFFSQQFKSSKWVLSNMHHDTSASQLTPNMRRRHHHSEDVSKTYFQHQHHRHWQQVLDKVSLMSISSMLVPLPEAGTVLGGTMDLHGNNISLACFHGVNFKAKSWALFSLKEPFISFSTEAQETRQPEGAHTPSSSAASNASTCCVHVVQNLNFSLGQQNSHAMSINSVQHESMAMVCRITRNVMFPPQFRTLHEWFHYAFAPSEIDDVGRFPSLERERERVERERADSGGSERRTPARLHDPNHNREVIFALPSLELFFKTEHLQACSGTPDVNSGLGKPVVECSFITEFGDHIFVTVDAEAFFFLHDLITSYIKEKEKLVSAQLAAGRSQSPSVRMESVESDVQFSSNISKAGSELAGGGLSPRASKSESTSPSASTITLANKSRAGNMTGSSLAPPLSLEHDMRLQRDWRDYHCKTWQLEPTVRLLSWAGKSIEPYGVDYILQKLGFSHARITIPKWMQRGFCDPLDKVLSVLIFRMVDLARREGSSSKD